MANTIPTMSWVIKDFAFQTINLMRSRCTLVSIPGERVGKVRQFTVSVPVGKHPLTMSLESLQDLNGMAARKMAALLHNKRITLITQPRSSGEQVISEEMQFAAAVEKLDGSLNFKMLGRA